jgi:hypothetical protein
LESDNFGLDPGRRHRDTDAGDLRICPGRGDPGIPIVVFGIGLPANSLFFFFPVVVDGMFRIPPLIG